MTTNGLPGNLPETDIIGKDNDHAVRGPVITVGRDSASNEVPVMAAVQTLYYLPYGESNWVTITNYPNGSRIATLFWDELMVGTSIGLYGQGINVQLAAITLADPAMVDSAGAWCVWFTSMGYRMGGPWNLGVSGTPLAADFDGR